MREMNGSTDGSLALDSEYLSVVATHPPLARR